MQYEFLEITELRKLLDTKQVTSVELTKYFLERAKRLNPQLNAYLTFCEDHALEQARAADLRLHSLLATRDSVPALLGIPYAAKDMFLTKGVRTTAASKILDTYIPPYDATVIKKLNEQGAVLLGKNNQDQFAHGSSGESSAYGVALNPWDTTRMTGGSTSGGGGAVSAGMAPFALGTDTGGSIRNPASLCGVTGYKPTYGRVSRFGVISMASSLDTIGFLSLSVEDTALITSIIAGIDPYDSTTGPNEVPNYHQHLKKDLTGMKIGIPKEYFIDGMDPEVEKLVRNAIAEVKKLGAEIIEVSLPSSHYGQMVYAILCPSEVSSNLARYDGIRFPYSSPNAQNLLEVYTKTRGEGFGLEAQRRILTGTYVLSHGYYDAYYKKAQKIRGLLINEFNDIFQQVDVLLTPTSPNVAPKSGVAYNDPIFAYIADQLAVNANLAGLPALSVPCGFATPKDSLVTRDSLLATPTGLPVGLQIIGPQWGEQKIFNVGYAFQEATDWHKKHPGEEKS